jgi:hypothetical protein
MSVRKVAAMFLLLGVVGAVWAGSASAKVIPPLEEVPTLRFIEKGDPMRLTSDDFTLVTSGLTVQCGQAELDGALQTNGLKKDQFSITGATFGGGGSSCMDAATGGAVTVSATPPTGGWLDTIGTNGKNAVGNPDFIGNPGLLVEVAPGPPANMRCFFEAKMLKGFDAGDTHGIIIVNSNVAFKLDRTSSADGCEKKASVSASWALTTSVPGSTSGAQAPVAFG